MVVPDTNSDLVRIAFVYIVPFAIAFLINWMFCNEKDQRKRWGFTILTFVVLLSIFYFIPWPILKLLIVYTVPLFSTVIVYLNTSEFSMKKRLIISIIIFIISVSIIYIINL